MVRAPHSRSNEAKDFHPLEAFEGLDADGDGKTTVEEFEGFMGAMKEAKGAKVMGFFLHRLEAGADELVVEVPSKGELDSMSEEAVLEQIAKAEAEAAAEQALVEEERAEVEAMPAGPQKMLKEKALRAQVRRA